VLVLAFTGFGGGLTMPTFDFFGLTRLLNYSRIMMRDESGTFYLKGIPGIAPGFEALLQRLQADIKQLAPDFLMVLGTSGGAYAAILFGHLLKADLVHAFSPFTNLDPRQDLSKWHEYSKLFDAKDRIASLPENLGKYLDLRQVLAQGNGKTRFNLHVCAKSPWDMERAMYLRGEPQVSIHTFPCDHHLVAIFLAKARILESLVQPEIPREEMPAVIHWQAQA